MEHLANLSPWGQLKAPRLPRRLVQLMVGLTLYGVSMGMMVESHLGLDPWDVFHDGVAKKLPLSFGMVVIVTGVVVLLFWIPMRQMPGLGTVANAIVIGVATDATLTLLPTPDALGTRSALLVGGVVLNGLAGALYIGAQLGPGPRDGLMTGLVRRTGLSVRLVRTSLELTVLTIGLLLGGTVGLGTVLYALAIGPLLQLFLPHTVVSLEPRPTRRGRPCDRSHGRPHGRLRGLRRVRPHRDDETADVYRSWMAAYRPATPRMQVRTW